jgi:hypothetical protein
MRDSIVEEVRKVREEHAARFNYELAPLAAVHAPRSERRCIAFRPESTPTSGRRKNDFDWAQLAGAGESLREALQVEVNDQSHIEGEELRHN